MGMYASATFVYGVDFGYDEESLPWGCGSEDEDGYAPDFDEWVRSLYEKDHPLNDPAIEPYGEWYKRYDAWEETFPLDMVYYSAGDEDGYILALRGTDTRIDWGEAAKVTREVSEAEVQRYLDACKEHGIVLPDDPAWLVCVNFG